VVNVHARLGWRDYVLVEWRLRRAAK
jgi:hypothetical protein